MPDRPGLRPRSVTPRPYADLVSEAGVPVVGGAADDTQITGVTHDSRQVRPGDLYMALPGASTHGARFASGAADAGAVAVLTDPEGAQLAGVDIPVLVTDDPRAHMGHLAAVVYGRPSEHLLMLGVTGTNGKTTTTYLLESGLHAAGHRTGVIGTVGTRIGDERVDSVRTTPEATDVHALLAVMLERGVTACAMEVSSHAMAFGRVDGVKFDVVGFTNLSHDHLDFHGDLEEYFAAKARLFTPERARRGVVVAGDDYARRLTRHPAIPTVAIGDDWSLETGDGVTLLAGPDGGSIELRVPLPGDFNVTNAALAVVMLVGAGVDKTVAAEGVAACSGVPGRMERITADGAQAPVALVDFAHTPDAIDNVLRALRPQGRLIVVLGAGGDRDRDKRALMGAAAARVADVVIVTDDNPRSEDAAVIRAAVANGARPAGATHGADVRDVAGRRAAIRTALRTAEGPGDTVVVLGKGHEQGQEIAGVVHPFDDRDVLREELRRWSEERSR